MAICRIYGIARATLDQFDEVDAKFPEHPQDFTWRELPTGG